MRLIDADALLKAIIQMSLDGNVFDRIHEASTIEPQRKKGKWINCNGCFATCSVCGDRWGAYGVMNFCPNCGAEMGDKG